MAAYEVLLLNTAIPQIQAAQSGDTYLVPRDIAFSTVASFAAGAEATPSIVATGDTNTGIWFPAADTVAISTGGISRLRLDSSGNLGLGVTPSASWPSTWKVMQLANRGSLAARTDVNSLYLGSNYYWDGTNLRYLANGYVTQYFQNDGAHYWATAGSGTAGNIASTTTAMTLDASGNLGIGAATNDNRLNISGISNYRGIGLTTSTASARCTITFVNTDTNTYGSYIQDSSAGDLCFGRVNADYGGHAERARITSGGYFYVGFTSGPTAAGSFYSTGTSVIAAIDGDAASADIMYAGYSDSTTTALGTLRFQVAANGNVTNSNGSYGTISDAKMKTDIVDAGSQWSDIKALRFRKFKMKDDPSGLVQLGVVAQEVEQTSPGLVDEHADKDAEGNDLGTTTKSVKTSVLLMKAAVALQEAMARIEKLEAEVAALKGA